jgi:hypothetical protein
VREMDAYPSLTCYSLFSENRPLLTHIFSLLIFAGNLPGSICGTGLFHAPEPRSEAKKCGIPCKPPC